MQPGGRKVASRARNALCTRGAAAHDSGCTCSYRVMLRPSSAIEARNSCQCRSGVKSDQSMIISGVLTPARCCRASASYSLAVSACSARLPSSRSMRLMLCLTATGPRKARPRSLNASRLPDTTASTVANRLEIRFACTSGQLSVRMLCNMVTHAWQVLLRSLDATKETLNLPCMRCFYINNTLHHIEMTTLFEGRPQGLALFSHFFIG